MIAANGFLKVYTTFSFIVSCYSYECYGCYQTQLQSEYYDIIKAYSEVQAVIEELKVIREDDTLLHIWYSQAEKLAEGINVTPQVPRTTSRQCHRDNVEHSSVEEY